MCIRDSLGRDPDPFKGRDEYIKWDKIHTERLYLARRLRYSFPHLTVALGGQTGIDIGPEGSDKSQILRDFRLGEEIHFFGDRMEKGGNDYSLAEAVKEMGGFPHHVKNWEDTRTQLLGLYD